MFHWVDFPSSSMVSWYTPWIFEDFLLVPHRAIPREEAEKDNPKPDAKSKVKAKAKPKAKAKAKSSSRRSAGRARFTFQWFKWPNDGWMRLMRQASIHGGKIEASQVSWPDGLYYGLFMFKKTQRNLKTWTPSRSPSQAGKSPGISSHLYGKKHGFPLVKKNTWMRMKIVLPFRETRSDICLYLFTVPKINIIVSNRLKIESQMVFWMVFLLGESWTKPLTT